MDSGRCVYLIAASFLSFVDSKVSLHVVNRNRLAAWLEVQVEQALPKGSFTYLYAWRNVAYNTPLDTNDVVVDASPMRTV